MFALKSNLSRLRVAVLFIALVGGFIRFYGAYPSFNQFHSDEGITYSTAVSMIRNGNLDPLRYDYPALVPVLNFMSFRTIFIPLYWTKYYITNVPKIIDGYVPLVPVKEDFNRVFQTEILGDREINALFWGRYTTAFVSTLSILLLYGFGAKIFNKQVGLISAILLALSFRAVSNSHIGLPDTYNAFFLIFSVYASYSIIKHRSASSFLLAGIALGLSFATKYQVFCFLPFIYSYLISNPRIKNLSDIKGIITDRRLYIAGFATIVVFSLINPYLFIHFDAARQSVSEVSAKYAMGRNNINLFPLHYWIVNEHGPVLVGLMFLGTLLAFIKQRKVFFLLASCIVPFLFIMMYYSVGGFYVRNFISISPFFFVFAAFFIYSAASFIAARIKLPSITTSLVILVVALYIPVKNTIIHTQYYRLPWGYREIIGKTRQILKNGDTVVGHPFDPVPQDIQINRIPIAVDSLYSLAEAKEVKAQYMYINMDWAGDPFYGWMTSSFPENINYVLKKPLAQMRESYWGLTTEEMMRYVVTSAYKPWQASDAALFLIKVPNFEYKESRQLVNFNFSQNESGWEKNTGEDADKSFLSHNIDKSAIQIGPGQIKFGSARYSSPFIDIKPGYTYKLKADLFSDTAIPDTQKRVYLRVDYFSSKDSAPVMSSVSSRFSGKAQIIEHIDRAPQGTQYMQVSLATAKGLQTPVYMKSLTVGEGTYQEVLPKVNQIEFDEYVDLLYPNSHGNL